MPEPPFSIADAAAACGRAVAVFTNQLPAHWAEGRLAAIADSFVINILPLLVGRME